MANGDSRDGLRRRHVPSPTPTPAVEERRAAHRPTHPALQPPSTTQRVVTAARNNATAIAETAAGFLSPVAASASNTRQAADHAQRAKDAYNQGHYGEALRQGAISATRSAQAAVRTAAPHVPHATLVGGALGAVANVMRVPDASREVQRSGSEAQKMFVQGAHAAANYTGDKERGRQIRVAAKQFIKKTD